MPSTRTPPALALHHIAIPAATKAFYQTVLSLPAVQQRVNSVGWLQLGGAQLHCISGGEGAGRHSLEVTMAQPRLEEAVRRLKAGNHLLSEDPVVAVDPVGTLLRLRARDASEGAAASSHEIELTRVVLRSADVPAAATFLGEVLGLPRAPDAQHGAHAFVLAGAIPGARTVLEVVGAARADGRPRPVGRGLFDTHVCVHYAERAEMVARLRALDEAGAEVGGSGSQWFTSAPDGHILELSDAPHAQMRAAAAAAAHAAAAAERASAAKAAGGTGGAQDGVCAEAEEDESVPAVFFDAVENADRSHAQPEHPGATKATGDALALGAASGVAKAPSARAVQLELYADPICPWVAMTVRVLRRVLSELPPSVQLDVRVRPFVLDPRLPPFPASTTKRARYSSKRGWPVRTWAERTTAAIEAFNAAEARVDFTVEGEISSSVDCLRLLRLAAREGGPGAQLALLESLLAAFHERGANLGDPAVLQEAARAAGLQADVRAYLRTGEDAAEVVREAADAADGGVRGVPTLVWSAGPERPGRAELRTGSLGAEGMHALIRSLVAGR